MIFNFFSLYGGIEAFIFVSKITKDPPPQSLVTGSSAKKSKRYFFIHLLPNSSSLALNLNILKEFRNFINDAYIGTVNGTVPVPYLLN